VVHNHPSGDASGHVKCVWYLRERLAGKWAMSPRTHWVTTTRGTRVGARDSVPTAALAPAVRDRDRTRQAPHAGGHRTSRTLYTKAKTSGAAWTASGGARWFLEDGPGA
jgi:hypothetical protein